jgi:hypothetical protein
MIDPALIEGHPVSQLAAKWLEWAKSPRNSTSSLLSLLLLYLEGLPNDNHWREEIKTAAYRLVQRPPQYAAALMVGDQEEFQKDQEENEDQWAALKPHLDILYREIKEAKTLPEVGNVLLENMFNSLQHLSDN